MALGRDDTERDAGAARDFVQVSAVHGAWMEGRDLVVGGVSRDVRLCRVLVRELADEIRGQAVVLHPRTIGSEVMAHRRHHLAVAAQQLEVVGDVTGAAAEVAAQRGYQKRHIEHVDAIG